jgi:ABC-type nitrate/sulfonate/bicarbonate transport system substrate-binding protein
MMMTRRLWLAATAALLAAGMPAAQAQDKAQDKAQETIKIGYWTSGFSVGFGAVLEFGKFVEKQGLKPEWIRFADVNGPTKALITQSIDVGFAAPAAGAFALAIQDAPVEVVLATQIAEATFVSKDGSPIKTMQDLKGKKIGMSPVGSSTYALVAAVLERNFGLKPTDYTPVGGNEGQIVQFLQRGDIDVASLRAVTIASVPELKLQVLGKLVDEWKKMTKSDASPILAAAIVHRDFAKNHPEATTKFVRAMIEATKFGKEHNAEAAEMLKKASNLDAKNATSYAQLWDQIYTASLEPADVAAFKTMADIFNANGTIKGKVPDSLFNTTFYEQAKTAK